MTDTTDQFGHQVNVSGIAVKGVPRPVPVYNEFDSHGTLLNLPRLPQERNADYKKRLVDVFAHRASSTYIGLLNGITRELGLEYYKPITITLASGLPTSTQPAIEFIENKVLVYRDKPTNDLELELNRATPDDGAYWLQDLVSTLNTQSSYFTAAINTGHEPVSRTDNLINQSSAKLVTNFSLRQSHIQTLGHSNIQRNSVVFTDRSTYRYEVSQESDVNAVGRYYIDHENGTVKSYSVPAEGARVRYIFHLAEFIPIATPVIIRNLQSDHFKEEMFIQTISNDGSEALGVPTELGATIINELMSVFPMYWGE